MTVRDLSTESDLAKLMGEGDILVLDFWAPWCPPCKAFAPIFEAAAHRHPDVSFGRVNISEKEELSGPLEVGQIPALVVIREGVMVASHSGYLEEDQIDELLEQVRGLDMASISAGGDEISSEAGGTG